MPKEAKKNKRVKSKMKSDKAKNTTIKIKAKKGSKKDKGYTRKIKKGDLHELSRDWQEYNEDMTDLVGESRLIKADAGKNTEQDKKLMMWAGVTFFMILILLVWILNIKNIFKIKEADNRTTAEFNWNEIQNDFGQAMIQAKEGLDEIKSEIGEASDLQGENNSGVKAGTGELDKSEIEELKNRLKEIEKKLGAE